jgi:hypothetical protein
MFTLSSDDFAASIKPPGLLLDSSGICPEVVGEPWSNLPLHIHPTTALDTTFWNFISQARTQAGMHANLDELTETAFPSIGSLLNPASEREQRPISSCVGNHARVNFQIHGVPERIALMYHMCTLLRVSIHFLTMPPALF